VVDIEQCKSYKIGPMLVKGYNGSKYLVYSAATEHTQVDDVPPYVPKIVDLAALPTNQTAAIEGLVAECDEHESTNQNGKRIRRMTVYDATASTVVVSYNDAAGQHVPIGAYVRLPKAKKQNDATVMNFEPVVVVPPEACPVAEDELARLRAGSCPPRVTHVASANSITAIGTLVDVRPDSRVDTEGIVATCDAHESLNGNGKRLRRMHVYDHTGSVNVISYNDAAAQVVPPGAYVRLAQAKRLNDGSLSNFETIQLLDKQLCHFDPQELSAKLFTPLTSLRADDAALARQVSVAGVVVAVDEPTTLSTGKVKQVVAIVDESGCAATVALIGCDHVPALGSAVGFLGAMRDERGGPMALTAYNVFHPLPHGARLEAWYAQQDKEALAREALLPKRQAAFDTMPLAEAIALATDATAARHSVRGTVRRTDDGRYELVDGQTVIPVVFRGCDAPNTFEGEVAIRKPRIEDGLLKVFADTLVVSAA
jgi:aspartate 1-decarboxylase